MRLADEAKYRRLGINAGGPGSGRHPGNVSPALHAHLTGLGYKYQGDKKWPSQSHVTSDYQSPPLGSKSGRFHEQVQIHPDSSWTHGNGQQDDAFGHGESSLAKYASQRSGQKYDPSIHP